MDIEKSQRLVKFSNLIKDMVDYLEISSYLLQCRVISQTDHEKLSQCVKHRGNGFAMEDLIHLLGLRRGGFNGLIGALKDNDYIWLADQMETPSKDLTDSFPSTSKGIFPSIANNLKRRKSSRQSDRLSSETTFTSYRQSVPIDLGTLRRTDSQTIPSSSMASKFLSFPAKFISASLDNLKLVDDNPNIPRPEELKSRPEYAMNESDNDDDDDEDITTTAMEKLSKGNYALIYNIPEPSKSQIDPPSNVKIVSKIAEQLKFPEEFLKGLKAVRVGRISKDKTGRPLKVKFKSVEARNQFISVLKNQTEMLGLDSVLGQLEVVAYGKCSKKPDEAKNKGRWYQRRFLTLKKVKQQKSS